MIQALFGSNTANPVGTVYGNVTGQFPSWPGTETSVQAPWSAPGVFRNLVVEVDVAPGGAVSRTFTLRTNAAGTALTVTIGPGATTARLTGTDVAVAAGDLLALQHSATGGTPAAASGVRWSLDFEGTSANDSGYSGLGGVVLATAATRYLGVFNTSNLCSTTAADANQIVAAAGTLTRTDAATNTALTVGNGVTVYVTLNGVRQDGTGGTVDTTCGLVGAIRQASATYSLPLVAGDVVALEAVRVGTLGNRTWATSTAFTATTAGQAQCCGSTSTLSATVAAYVRATVVITASVSTETGFATRDTVGVTSMRLSGLRVLLNAAPGTGKSRTVDLRRAAASPGPSVTISDTATTGSDLVASAVLADGDLWNLRFVPSGTPATGTPVTWTFIQGPPVTVAERVQAYVWGPL